MLKQTFDTVARAMYLQVSPQEIAETVVISDSVYVDLAADGSPVGLELLGVAAAVPFVAGPDVHEALTRYDFPLPARLLMGAARFEARRPLVVTRGHSLDAIAV